MYLNLKTYLLWGWARQPIPTLVLLVPPTSPLPRRRVLGAGAETGARVLVSRACPHACGRVEVVGDVK